MFTDKVNAFISLMEEKQMKKRSFMVTFAITTVAAVAMTSGISNAATTVPDNATAVAKIKPLPRNSVGTAQLKSNAVTTSKIRNNAVTTKKIKNGSVTAAKIAAGAVTNTKIAAGAVTSTKIAAGAVGTAAIANGSVDPTKLAAAAQPAGGATVHNTTGYSLTAGTVMQVGPTVTVTAPATGGALAISWSATLVSYHNTATALDSVTCAPFVDAATTPQATALTNWGQPGTVIAGRNQTPAGGLMYIPVSSSAAFVLTGGKMHTVKIFCYRNAASTSVQQVTAPTINAMWMPAQY